MEAKEPIDGTQQPLMLDRRSLIIAASTAALAGCESQPSAPKSRARGSTFSPQSELSSPTHTHSVEGLLDKEPFFIAHRGSGDNWVEHTLHAYTEAFNAGAGAIEVSVSSTSDGVYVCHHDTNTKRMTGSEYEIADVTWKKLNQLRNDARTWLGPASPRLRLTKLTDVLKRFANTHVIFIEDKQGTNTTGLLELMGKYEAPTTHFIWKQWAGAAQYKLAKDQGFKTWGYFTSDLFNQIDTYADHFDLLGVPHTASDNVVREVVKKQKPVICWEVHRRSMRDRVLRLGVQGIMCSNIPYVMDERTPAKADNFDSGLRQAGDLPWTTDEGWAPQPTIRTTTGSLRIVEDGPQSYLMGSLCPIAHKTYSIAFEVRWPDHIPPSGASAGIAFGTSNDSAYRVGIASDVSGYHLTFNVAGSIELYRRHRGHIEGKLLKASSTKRPIAGQWIDLKVTITPTSISVHRRDEPASTFTIKNQSYRGGYFRLCKNYNIGPPVEFRRISVR